MNVAHRRVIVSNQKPTSMTRVFDEEEQDAWSTVHVDEQKTCTAWSETHTSSDGSNEAPPTALESLMASWHTLVRGVAGETFNARNKKTSSRTMVGRK